MKKSRSSILCIALLGALLSCTSPDDIVDYTEDLAVPDPAPGTTQGNHEDKKDYFQNRGDSGSNEYF